MKSWNWRNQVFKLEKRFPFVMLHYLIYTSFDQEKPGF